MRRHNYLANLVITVATFVLLYAVTNAAYDARGFIFSFVVAHGVGYIIGGLFA